MIWDNDLLMSWRQCNAESDLKSAINQCVSPPFGHQHTECFLRQKDSCEFIKQGHPQPFPPSCLGLKGSSFGRGSFGPLS